MDLLSEQIPIKFMKTDAHISALEKRMDSLFGIKNWD